MDEYSGFCMRSSRGGSGGGGGTGIKCGRWNPTSEQVKVLTELFRSGLRTPSTDQIQKISSQLSFYGKIESKNVFYWFQNHKARERQKRRRVLVDEDSDIIHNPHESTKVPSTKLLTDFEEIKQTLEPKRAKETLQLFPLDSFNGIDSDNKFRFIADVCKENSAYTYNFGTDQMNHHPTLDLRLSFI